jgi:heat shock protein HtpX
MSVYNHISANKFRTYLIIAVFIAIMTGFFFIVGQYFNDPWTYFLFGFGFSSLTSFWSYFNSHKVVLFTTGAKPADKKLHYDFYTVTENLAIASGLPMPKLYVIEDKALNAFATGRNPKNAVVGATTGLLDALDRSELEGVIAHELGHVKNYDILVASVVAVLVGTIALIADMVMRSMWWGGGNDRENRNPLMFALFIIVLILVPIVATLIQLAVSRRREFLADATGALTTRYPEGLARALEKIAGDKQVLHTASTSTAHLFISNPFKKKTSSAWLNLFSTHPPVEERIRILRSM